MCGKASEFSHDVGSQRLAELRCPGPIQLQRPDYDESPSKKAHHCGYRAEDGQDPDPERCQGGELAYLALLELFFGEG